MVLMVSDIIKTPPLPDFDFIPESDSPPKETTPLSGIIELTDGWYFIEAILDASLTILLQTHHIYPGLKLRIACSHMQNNENGCAPLEMTVNQPRRPQPSLFTSFYEDIDIQYYSSDGLCTPRLMLQYNGTRRAVWNSYLGFTNTHVFNVNVNDCVSDGGVIPQTDLLVVRKYGVRYQEMVDEKKIYRNQSEEEEQQKCWELNRERIMNDILARHDNLEMDDMEISQDYSQSQSFSQVKRKEKEKIRMMEEHQHELEEKISEALQREGIQERNVQMIGYLKVMSPYRLMENKQFDVSSACCIADSQVNPVIGAYHHLYSSITVTLWDTSPAAMDALSEGSIYRVTMLQASSKSHSPSSLSLYASNNTHWEDITAEYRDTVEKVAKGELEDRCNLYQQNVFDVWKPRCLSSLSESSFEVNQDYDLLLYFLFCSDRKEHAFDSPVYYYDITCCDLYGHVAIISVNEGLFVGNL